MYVIKQYLLFFFGLSCFALSAQNTNFIQTLDSIQHFRKLSDDASLNLETRLEYAKKASELSYKTEVDSTILLSNRKLAIVYEGMGNSEMLSIYSHKNLKLAKKLKDTLAIGIYNKALGIHNYRTLKQNDSAYYYLYNALKIFKSINEPYHESDVLTNIANLQNDEQNYTESDFNLVKVIKILESLPKKNNWEKVCLVEAYLLIGNNNEKLKLYKKAIDYYKKALYSSNELPEDFKYPKQSRYSYKQNIFLYIQINIAEVYKKNKKFQRAISIYTDLFNKNSSLTEEILYEEDPITYAAVKNNLAYNLYKSKNQNFKKIKTLFNQAYKIFYILNSNYEITAGGNDMAEFYNSIGKKDSALILSKRSYNIGKEIKDFHEVSRSLLLLSKLEKGNKGKQYLYEHIKLNDSLLDTERASRNKFARIKFETDNYIKEAKRLTTRNTLLIITGSITLLALVLLFIFRHQKIKNQKLIFEDQQQKNNEEIYSLMIQEQTNIENGKLVERHEISEELHDGILNSLTGTRLGIEFSFLDDEFKENLSDFIKEIKTIEKEISALAYNLKNTQIANTNFNEHLKEYIENQCKLNKIQFQINYRTNILWQDVNDIVRINLFRVLQESLQNVVKHAKASLVTFNFNIEGNKLHLNIIDNGIGFNPNAAYKGIGLKNIQSRISKLNGSVCFEPQNGKGTTVAIQLPIK